MTSAHPFRMSQVRLSISLLVAGTVGVLPADMHQAKGCRILFRAGLYSRHGAADASVLLCKLRNEELLAYSRP